MVNLGVFPGLGLTRADFDNNSVLNVVNPDPLTGYAYSPIPNNNPGWKPAVYHTAIAGSARNYDIKAADIIATPPLNLTVVLNKENIGVCDIVMNPLA
ncbi:hypothetical protein PENANT_c072G05171 [Penicillium antarcticum]|uniref:Uncharacterized protein n=1 Tax=Penicillium antarcticum TaxID=416450 RepID=A0A1V6PPI1_9EURO|nr:hypothetical protein PENANT_c072G05171 [Penicillium antarcticum]